MVMKTKLISVLTAMTMVAVTVVTGCSKDEESDYLSATAPTNADGRANLEVRLMDAPPQYDYESVNIEIKRVGVYLEPGETGARPQWVYLTTSAGTYDMLSLVNGKDVLLANEFVTPGHITQMMIEFGDHNSLVLDDRAYHLVPSDGQTKLLMKTDLYVTADAVLPVMIDFDVARSVVLKDDAYVLRPVARAISLTRTGSIHTSTRVITGGATAVFADDGMNQYTTYADRNTGEVLLRGLPPGGYTLMIYYPNADRPVVIEGVRVAAGVVTNVDGTLP